MPEGNEASTDTASASKAGIAGAVPAKTVSAPTAARSTGKVKVKPSETASAGKPTLRAGTKQARMIELLKRPEGATVEQIAERPPGRRVTTITGPARRHCGSRERYASGRVPFLYD